MQYLHNHSRHCGLIKLLNLFFTGHRRLGIIPDQKTAMKDQKVLMKQKNINENIHQKRSLNRNIKKIEGNAFNISVI